MFPLDWINLWVLGPAIGFGTFLLLTLLLALVRSRFRKLSTISFFFFALTMLTASAILMTLTHQFVFQHAVNLPPQDPAGQTFISFTILLLAASLTYFIFVEVVVSGSLHWQRLLIISGAISILLAALANIGILQFFPLNQNTGASGYISAAYLLSTGYFLAAAIYFFRKRNKQLRVFGITPLIILVGLNLNALFLDSILIASISIWVMYLFLTITTIFEGMIKPTDVRMQEVETLNEELVEAYDTTLEGWAKALELRDKETVGHSRRVTALAIDLAHALGLGGRELQNVKFGALLHDIGKMAIPDEILKKPGRLNTEERKIIESHPQAGFELIQDIKYLTEAAKILLCHHEKWNGSGYPTGLAGEEIPYIARLFAVVDVWDAITSNRPYATAWPIPMARAYLQEEKSISFDPDIVDVFLKFEHTYK